MPQRSVGSDRVDQPVAQPAPHQGTAPRIDPTSDSTAARAQRTVDLIADRTAARADVAERAARDEHQVAMDTCREAFAESRDDDGFAWMQGLDGMRATLAELHAHRMLTAADPTATLLGGNAWYRDHEVFNNDAWVNTRSA